MSKKPYSRDKGGQFLDFHGMNTVSPPDRLPAGKFVYAQNVRRYLHDAIAPRAMQDNAVETLPFAVHTLRRLNDSTPAGPPAGFILVGGALTNLYAGTTPVGSGLSGNPLALVPFRPDASVQPWMYVGDSAQMLKVRSDGLTYKMGVAEPQVAPTVNATPVSNVLSLIGPVTVYVWNMANGDSSSTDGTPFIWKNPNDPSGRGPVETIATAALSTTGDTLMFDDGVIPAGSYAIPVQWAAYEVGVGTLTVAGGVNVTWDTGTQFNDLTAGDQIFISTIAYPILTVIDNTHLTLASPAVDGVGLNFYFSVPDGTTILYQPALSPDGYVFNAAILGTLYVPTAGTYLFTGSYVNDIIYGIGSSGTGQATFVSGAGTISNAGQTKTVVSALPLLPRDTQIDGNGYSFGNFAVNINFSQPGNYPIEIDWNYGDDMHATPARTMYVQCNGQNIAPLPATVITAAQYRYTYRSSATGATSNPSPESLEQVFSVLANTLTPTPSTDPQVDKIDWYRLDESLENFTYVGTSPNNTTPFVDSLLDVDIAANPILAFDNYEPFPSIDLPKAGIVNVVGGVVTWFSGDQFNVRWLGGTVIIVGTVAYTLDKRPTSTTTLTASNTENVGGIQVVVPVPDGTGLVYEIAEPILAAQPLPHIWGPTDNINFSFGCRDPLRPGTLYWCKGGNLDSAPDTNQEDVTSPSEPLMNGCMSGGYGIVMSTERGWLIVPNFFNALATVQGTEGSTWTLQLSISDRGLYMEWCLAVDGGGNFFFRAKDGIYISPGGQGSKSITDADLYNIFPHEGFVPQPVNRGGFTVYPPDDTLPQLQKLSVANGYLYYDYNSAQKQTAGISSAQSVHVTGPIFRVTLTGIGPLPVWVVLQARVIVAGTGFGDGTFFITGVNPGLPWTISYDKSGIGVEPPTPTPGATISTLQGTPQTLVYDIAAGGWVVDAYQYPATVHMLEEGAGVNGVLTGNVDGSVRPLTNSGAETGDWVILMPSSTEGDARAEKHFGDCYIEAGPKGS